MNPVELIERKRDGGSLTREEFHALISGYLAGDGSVMEGQIAAFLMAGVLQGFTVEEARSLTTVLLESGDRLDLSGLRGPTIDKHSTGGVGDGTTLVVAPLLAAAGAQVVKLSGRGLGHTGGTLDKLESIPGFRVGLSAEEIMAQAEDIGCVVAAQTADLVPGDKALYALRDVTGTVESIALIASSVMSKKLASGAEVIVLDVKTGDGAFMTTMEDAHALARLCVDIGTDAGRRTRAIVSNMDTPLGSGIGNGLEVVEVVETLQAPPEGRFDEVCLTLATLGLAEATGEDEDAARRRLQGLWVEGTALETFRRMVTAQGGDPAVCDRPRELILTAPVQRVVAPSAAGVVDRMAARPVGLLSMRLGAGRQHVGDDVDPAVGIELHVEEGTAVEAGQPLATIHARDEDQAAAAEAALLDMIQLGEDGEAAPTVLATVG